jgi:hypothetical protein
VKKFLEKDSIVIDGFDNTESRKNIYDFCLKEKIDCIHAGLYKDYGEVCWNETYHVPGPVQGPDVCEYPLARNIIMLTISVAAESIISFLKSGVKRNFMITLQDLKISSL